MSECGTCYTKTSRYDDLLHCSSPECNNMFHINCVHVSVEKFTKMKTEGNIKSWKCPKCLPQTDGLETRVEIMLKNFFQEIKKDMSELKSSQSFISDQYETVMNRLNEVANLKTKVAELEVQITEKNKKIEHLECRLNHVEQYGRNRQLEIRNIAQLENEDVEKIVCTFANKLGVKLTPSDIQACHRLPNRYHQNKPSAIIIELASRKKRNDLLSIKSQKTLIKSSEIVGVGNESVFFGESLSPYFKNLLWKTKQNLKETYRFIWFKKNKIFVKKDESSPTNVVESEIDINKIKNK